MDAVLPGQYDEVRTVNAKLQVLYCALTKYKLK